MISLLPNGRIMAVPRFLEKSEKNSRKLALENSSSMDRNEKQTEKRLKTFWQLPFDVEREKVVNLN